MNAASDSLPFAGLRVIDCAEGIAGSVAAMMLGQMGAEVVKVEPTGGSKQRGSAGFAARQQGKRSIVLDLETDGGNFVALLAGADVLIHEPGLPAPFLATAPHLVTSCISSAPPGIGHDDLPADDFLVMAAIGLLDEQPATRRDGPAFVRLPFGSYCAAWLAATGIGARLFARMRGAPPGPADTSIMQGALLPAMMLWRDAERPTEALGGRIDKRMLPSIFECADGIWLHIMKNADDTPLMKQLLDEMGPEAVASENAKWPAHFRYKNWGANVRAFRSRPSAEWLEDLWAADIPVQPAMLPGELYADAQAVANRYVVEIEDHEMGRIRVPGAPVTINPAADAGRPVSKIGADRDAVLALRKPAAFPALSGSADSRLLAGVRVVDFGNYLAGPLATMLLADLGADVIKVEPPAGDPMRANESAFLGCQRGKRSLALDLRRPEAREIIDRLVEGADIVHHNIRLPTARKFGLAWEDVSVTNPRAIFGHVSAYGPEGVRRHWPGYDQLFQACTGWEWAHAGEGNRPAWLRFGMMDHMCAASLAFGMMAALYRRERTGRGSPVAASLLGAAVLTMSGTAMRADGSLTNSLPALDADQTGPIDGRGLAKCVDGWIAYAGPDQRAPAPQSFASYRCDEALSALGARGYAAIRIPEEAGKAFLHDAALEKRGLVARYSHPVYGELRHPGAFWSMEATPVSPRRAPPVLDQHREEILAEIGFSPTDIARFEKAGIVGASEGMRT